MITLDLSKLELISEKSSYNHNFYKHKKENTGTIILIESNEEYSRDDVYVINGESKIFLGSCYNFNCDDVLRLNLGEQYT